MAKLVLGFLLLFPFFVYAQNEWRIVESEVNFEIKNAGIIVKGNFGNAIGTIRFDKNNIKGASMKVSVQVKKLNTGIEARDKHLKKKEYFDASAFPEILMESKFFGLSEIGFKGYFVLTMKGVSKEIVVPFIFLEGPNGGEMFGEFSVNRLDFGLGGSSIIMADLVNVKVRLKLAEK